MELVNVKRPPGLIDESRIERVGRGGEWELEWRHNDEMSAGVVFLDTPFLLLQRAVTSWDTLGNRPEVCCHNAMNTHTLDAGYLIIILV